METFTLTKASWQGVTVQHPTRNPAERGHVHQGERNAGHDRRSKKQSGGPAMRHGMRHALED